MISSSTDPREIRKFGFTALVFFGLLSCAAIWRGKNLPAAFFGALSALGLCLCLLPGPLSLVYTGWVRTARLIGKATNLALLSAAYFLVITPAALIHRLVKGSPLPVSPDPSVRSYWVPRQEPAQPRERFTKRY